MKRITIALFIACLCASNLNAAIVSYDIDTVFTGCAPEGAGFWLNVTFDDEGTAGSVNMTLTATNLTGNEKVGQLYLNLDPVLSPTSLSFSSPTQFGTFDTPAISKGVDGYKADGDGYFDVLFDFSTSEGHEFGVGESVSYVISGISTLTAESFEFISYNKQDSKIGYLVAAHVQSIGPAGNSGWVTVPEPATLAILGIGSLLFLRKRRLR